MIDQSTIALPTSNAPVARPVAARDKAGDAGQGQDDSGEKAFGDIVNEFQGQGGSKSGAKKDEATTQADDTDNAADAAAAQAAAKSRVKISAGLQNYAKLFAAPTKDAEHASTGGEVTDRKNTTKKDNISEKNAAAQVKEKDVSTASEALSFLLATKEEAASAGETNQKVETRGKRDSDRDDDGKTVHGKEHAGEAASAVNSAKSDVLTAAVAGNHLAEAVKQQAAEGKNDDTDAADKVRLVSADGKGRPVDIVVSPDAQKSKADDAEAAQSSGGKTDFVTVLESRRYLGFSSDSNAAALTSAIKGDSSLAAAIRDASIGGTTQTEVNTLKLQLNPEHLGSMTASLRLKGDELSVDVRVETVEAYRQLSNDQDGIVRALRDQGFTVDQVTVQLSPTAKSDMGNNSGSQADGRQNLQDGQSDARQRDDNGRRAANQGNWASNGQTSSFDDSGSNDADSARNIYL